MARSTTRRPAPTTSLSTQRLVPQAPAASGRDDRLDFLRGLAVAVMVVDHLVGASWLHDVTMGQYYATAAEAFVVCSGLVLGLVVRRRVAAEGLRAAVRRLLLRARTLYVAAVVLMVALGALAIAVPGAARPCFDAAPASFGPLVMAALTFRLAPPVADVLPLYVLLLLATPALAWALARGRWLPALAISAGLWAINWLEPYALSGVPLDRGRPYFAFASWQLLYAVAFVIGWHREAVARWLARTSRAGNAAMLAVIVVGLALVAQQDGTLGGWAALGTDRESWYAATDRSLLGPLRLVAVAALFPLIAMGVDMGWRPLSRWAGPLLMPLGRHALYVYLLHMPLVVAWTGLVYPRFGESAFVGTLGQLAALALLWVAVRQRFLFRVIPS